MFKQELQWCWEWREIWEAPNYAKPGNKRSEQETSIIQPQIKIVEELSAWDERSFSAPAGAEVIAWLSSYTILKEKNGFHLWISRVVKQMNICPFSSSFFFFLSSRKIFKTCQGMVVTRKTKIPDTPASSFHPLQFLPMSPQLTDSLHCWSSAESRKDKSPSAICHCKNIIFSARVPSWHLIPVWYTA